MANCNDQIEELELLVRKSCLKLANSLLYHIWKLVPPDVTNVIRLPLFSRATLNTSGRLGTRLIFNGYGVNRVSVHQARYEVIKLMMDESAR